MMMNQCHEQVKGSVTEPFLLSRGTGMQGWWEKPLDSFTQFYPG